MEIIYESTFYTYPIHCRMRILFRDVCIFCCFNAFINMLPRQVTYNSKEETLRGVRKFICQKEN